MYRGAFLSGFFLKDSPTFENWQIREEENLRLEQLYVLERLVKMHGSAGEYEKAVEKYIDAITLEEMKNITGPLTTRANQEIDLLMNTLAK